MDSEIEIFTEKFEKDADKYLVNLEECLKKNVSCIHTEISCSYETNPHINVMLSSIHCVSDAMTLDIFPVPNSQNKVVIDKDFSPIPYSMQIRDKETNKRILEMNYPSYITKEHMKNFILSSSNQNNQPTKI